MTRPPALELVDATLTYRPSAKRTVTALRDINLRVHHEEFVFLVGPSGSGKSSLIRLLTREASPEDGTVTIAGKDIHDLAGWRVPRLRRDVGVVYQDFKLLPKTPVHRNVALALEVAGYWPKEIRRRTKAALELVQMSEKAHALPEELSGGQAQRVSIARALVRSPRVLLCDEPTGNLDPQTSKSIMTLLDRINRKARTTVLVATHDEPLVNAFRRRVVELDDGRIARDEEKGSYRVTS